MSTAATSTLVPTDLPGIVVDEATDLAGPYATAVFDTDRKYRYLLTRTWDTALPKAVLLMLNPSTADALADDATIRRCKAFAKDEWGCGGIVVVNLFALRSTDPSVLRTHADPVGPHNAVFVRQAVRQARLVVGAWGAGGILGNRGWDMARALRGAGIPLKCFGVTSTGQPLHPLYRPKGSGLVPFEAGSV